MAHKVKIAMSILKTLPDSMFLGFLKGDTITCDINDYETATGTAIKLAMKYVDVDIDILDINKAGFFSAPSKPSIIDAKTGKSIDDTGPTTYLWFRVKVSPSAKVSEKIDWISVSNHDELFKIPMYQFHLDSMMG